MPDRSALASRRRLVVHCGRVPSSSTRTYTPFYGQIRRKCTLFSNSAGDFDNTAQCMVVWKQCNYVGAEKPPFGMVQSISADQQFNLDIAAAFGEVHTISVIRKAIQAVFIQFRQCQRRFGKAYRPISHPPDLSHLTMDRFLISQRSWRFVGVVEAIE